MSFYDAAPVGEMPTEAGRTREQQVLHLAAEGMTDRQMADRLGISVETVGSYWRRILARFGASSRTEVVAKVLRREHEELNEQRERLLFEIAERARTERLLTESHMRMSALMHSLRSGVLFETDDRRVVFANEGFVQLFRIPAEPAALVGMDCKAMAKSGSEMFEDAAEFLRRIDEILAARVVVHNELVTLADGRVLRRDYAPIVVNGEPDGHMWHYFDSSW